MSQNGGGSWNLMKFIKDVLMCLAVLLAFLR